MPDLNTELQQSPYPLGRKNSPEFATLIQQCRTSLADKGMFNLPGLLSPQTCAHCVETLLPRFRREAFVHRRQHNVFFSKNIPEIADSHPANTQLETCNQTLCHDQLADTVLSSLYYYQPFIDLLAASMGIPHLYPMTDPLAAVNVMAYHEGEALNWHFDRSEFTTTLLLQAPDAGGLFEYRRGLKTAGTKGTQNIDYDAVGRLVAGVDGAVECQSLSAGTLNVFCGSDTLHRVSPIAGTKARIIAVFSYFERPGVEFSATERIGFYGREN